jgi:hypothetical protein
MATDYTIASTSGNGGTWSIQQTDTSSVVRYLLLALVDEGLAGSGNVFKQCRPGVFPGPSNAASSNQVGAFFVAPTSGLGFTVQPGAAVVERGTLVGPYLVVSTAAGTCAVSTADPSQTRVDRVDLQVFDGALGDNGSVSLTRIHITTGTPGAGLPAAPIDSIPIGSWSIPAGTTTLTTGMWTDSRKSTAVRGATRVLLPGDALTDPGFNVGEKRLRFHTTYGWLEDIWDASTSTWRGTQVIILPQSAQVASGSLANNVAVMVSSTAIADPGFPYYVEAEGLVDFASGTQGTVLQVTLQVDSSTFGTNKFAFDQEPAVAANISFDLGSGASGNSRVFGGLPAGLHTVYLMAQNKQGPGGPASITIYTNFYTFAIKIIPALV